MRLKTRIWLVSLVLVVAGALVWRFADKRGADANNPSTGAANDAQPFALQITNHAAPGSPDLKSMFAVVATNPPNAVNTNKFAYRLSNTKEPLDSLIKNERAILLRNALIDTALPGRSEIPRHLKAQGDPGSYVVQARGAITQEYRDWLEKTGAKIVSYIPNNSFLIRADAEIAKMIGAARGTQAVLPFEPYYKFDSLLLPLAVNEELSPYEQLNIVAFPGQSERAKEELEKIGGQATGPAERTLLGDVFPAKVPATGLPAVAQIAEVHMVGVRFEKKLANDLSRVKLRVSRTATNRPPNDPATTHYGAPATNNYLTGQGILVGVNDTGADSNHVDFQNGVLPGWPRRVGGLAANGDLDGHGTHVIGSLLGDGTGSPLTGTNVAGGSRSNAIFYGTAPKATAYVQDYVGPDTALQTNTALTNILISNNSWGYGNNDYDIFAASYDAAVRDSLPGRTGEQEVAYVFAAGNDGGGGASGLNGIAGSILSPATAKNVITVGGSDQARFISNTVYKCTSNMVVTTDPMGAAVTNFVQVCTTNSPWLGETDSDNQVAPFSSRGNVGIGIEGSAGRFKPDVIAPGAMVVSARSGQFSEATGSTNFSVFRYNSLSVANRTTNLYALNIPAGAVAVLLTNLPNLQSPTNPLPPLVMDADFNAIPADPALGTNGLYLDGGTTPPLQSATTMYYTIANPFYSNTVVFDLVVRLTFTNDTGNYFDELSTLNSNVAPHYRYESGTSMAAPKISGMLAMIQEYLAANYGGMRPSPALLKAMIINGARSLSANYNLDTHAAINHQGWGIASISNSLPIGVVPSSSTGPMRFYDQDITNGLATGGTQTYQITVPNQARSYPLRLSLVWTDPPGNPISGVKLVNDLNMVVTGQVTTVVGGQPFTSSMVWVGNNFPPGSDFTAPIVASSTDPDAQTSTNLTLEIEGVRDAVNNVENVYIAPPLATSYTVVVKAHRVNVNALNSHSNSIAQDYALVVSSGNVAFTNANITVTGPTFTDDPSPRVAALMRTGTNSTSATLFNQRVGANSSLVVSTNGSTNQWSFFVYTNVPDVNFRHVMIVTFLPPNLSLARYRDADIDLYVRRESEGANPVLFTNELDATEISLAQKSTLRVGTEFVVYSNALPNEVFYIGVKSEDQQAANFSILAASSDQPFSGRDSSNNIVARALVLPMDIPDGTPDNPGGTTNLFAFVPDFDVTARRVYVTNDIFHEQAGDIIGILSHTDTLGDGTTAAVVLNNHRTWNGFDSTIYDDSMEGDLEPPLVPNARPPDGPGTLRSFVGHNAFGQWNLNVSDNALFHTGLVDHLTVVIEPASNTNDSNAVNITRTILPNRWFYAPVNVPFDAFNMEICLSDFNPPPPGSPLDLFVKQGSFPTFGSYDFYWRDSTNVCHDIGLADNPPLTPGRWFVGIFNSNAFPVTVTLRVFISRQAIPGPYFTQFSTNTTPLFEFDDAVTNSKIFWTNYGKISDLRVGLRVDHERASDLVFHLRSPTGKRLLLMENRGRLSALGMGANATNYVTNVASQVFFDGFEFSPADATYAPGDFVSGWSVFGNSIENLMSVSGVRQAHTGTNFIDLNGPVDAGGVRRGVNLTVGKLYRLSWAYTRNPDSVGLSVPEAVVRTNGVSIFTNSTVAITNTWLNLDWRTVSMPFVALNAVIDLEFASTTPGSMGVLLDSVRLEEMNVSTNNYLYTTFTENTNLTLTPIKFGQPPFTNSPSPDSGIIFQDGFELAPLQWPAHDPLGLGYGAGTVIPPGWLVEVDDVDILGFHPQYLPAGADTGTNALEIHGNLAGKISYGLPTTPGVTYELSFAYVRNSHPSAAPEASATVAVQGIANMLITATAITWAHTSMVFTAVGPQTLLTVEGLPPKDGSGVIFDTFLVRRVVSQTGANDGYFLPEESIRPFFGEQAYGEWTLEVWDNRLGPLPVAPTNSLLSWKLEMAFAVTNPPLITLTNGQPYTNIIEGSNVLYFVVNSACSSGFITNTLTNITMNGGIDLIFNQFVLPTNGPGDVPLLFNVLTNGSTNLIMGAPPLVFPSRYFLRVQNTDPATTNEFSLDFGVFCNTNVIIPLTNSVLRCNETVAGNGFQDYSFATSASATQAIVEVFSSSGNVDLYLRRGGTAPATCSTTPLTLCSANPGTANEVIVLDWTNAPALGGTSGWGWTIRVFNNESTDVTYCVRVTVVNRQEVTVLPVNPVDAHATNTTAYADYYVVNIPPCPAGANFQLTETVAGSVTMYLRTNYFPTPDDYLYSTNEAGNGVIIGLYNTSTPYPLTAGDWFITVLHTSATTPTAYDIQVLFNSDPGCGAPDIQVSAASFTGDGFNLNWQASPSQTYQVQYTDTLPANWQNVGGPVTSTNGQFHFKDDGSQTGGVGPQRFYRLVLVE